MTRKSGNEPDVAASSEAAGHGVAPGRGHRIIGAEHAHAHVLSHVQPGTHSTRCAVVARRIAEAVGRNADAHSGGIAARTHLQRLRLRTAPLALRAFALELAFLHFAIALTVHEIPAFQPRAGKEKACTQSAGTG